MCVVKSIALLNYIPDHYVETHTLRKIPRTSSSNTDVFHVKGNRVVSETVVRYDIKIRSVQGLGLQVSVISRGNPSTTKFGHY